VGVRFGTDGIRGLANVELTPELALAIGRAAARHLPSETFLVGSDTRQSGPMLLAALSAGIAAEGGQVQNLGVLPTPALAYLAAKRSHPAAMVSASHNPFYDNGIKLIAANGSKLPDALERAIEREIDVLLGGQTNETISGADVGGIESDASGLVAYEEYLATSFAASPASRLKVVCDCAQGAASVVAPRVLSRLGVELHVIGASPDGTNINDGFGSTDTAALAKAVLEHQADLGVAFDGDADRLIAVDERGDVVDGDQLIALFATDLLEKRSLRGGAVVVTVMSNLGLHRALTSAGIEVVECAVGDRNILEALEAKSLCFGGEQSGHLIFLDDATTGDGLLSALKLLDLLGRSKRPLSELATGAMTRLPQELRTVYVPEPTRYATNDVIVAAISEVELALGNSGRLLVRASGTESAVRVMVEAEEARLAFDAAERLAALVAEQLG
jgi:phosphoglucosamine mutase